MKAKPARTPLTPEKKAAKAAKFRETMALKKHMRTVQPTQPIGPAHQPILSERYLALACLKMILEM